MYRAKKPSAQGTTITFFSEPWAFAGTIFLRDLRITVVESFRGLRKFVGGPWHFKNGDLLAPRRQERQVRNCFCLCDLCAFARKILLRAFVVKTVFSSLVAALPRRVSVVNTLSQLTWKSPYIFG
jgi:hypothetical protein